MKSLNALDASCLTRCEMSIKRCYIEDKDEEAQPILANDDVRQIWLKMGWAARGLAFFQNGRNGAGQLLFCAMRLLDRYLFRELLTPLFFCLVGIQVFIIFVTAITDGEKISEAKLHFWQTIEYSAAASMELLPTVLPVSLLLALLMAVTQHARYNEITAMRAAGISLWRVCLPYFVAGIVASAALFALNELVVPRSLDFANRLLNRYTGAANTAKASPLNFNNESGHRMWFIENYRAATSEMTGIKVVWTPHDGSSRVLYADRGMRTNDTWTFFNAQEFERPGTNGDFVPVLKTNVLAMPEFPETPEEIRNEMKIAAYLGLGELHTLNAPLADIVEYLRWHPNLSRGDKGRLLTEIQDRLAKPLTCLVVVLIAIPFGAAPGRRNLFFGVA
ncbi:MAG TPA: LptF/LptG family permease, partial [Candidatus Acidoferrum sp.]|nr:LptF/LptG family permease [Candidatus Acidoferrum sp.]